MGGDAGEGEARRMIPRFPASGNELQLFASKCELGELKSQTAKTHWLALTTASSFPLRGLEASSRCLMLSEFQCLCPNAKA